MLWQENQINTRKGNNKLNEGKEVIKYTENKYKIAIINILLENYFELNGLNYP